MDVDATALKSLASYQAIAQDPVKRSVLLKDASCLVAVLYFVDDNNTQVATAALEVLCLLLEKQKHAEILQKDDRFLSALIQAKLKPNLPGHVSFLIDSCVKRLQNPEETTQKLKEIKNESANNSNMGAVDFKAPVHSKKRPVRFIGAMKAQTITFHFQGDCVYDYFKLIEERLLEVKGVISIYIDRKTCRCTVRAKLETKPEVIAAAVIAVGHFTVNHVTKNDYGEEVFTCMNTASADVDKENDDDAMPTYLNESLGDSPKADDRAIVAPGRASKKRRESNGWVSSVTSFLASSFYW